MARGPPLAICEGDASGGDPEDVVPAGGWSRERIAERTGSVSIESGVRPSGRGSSCGVWEGEVVIVSLGDPLLEERKLVVVAEGRWVRL